MVRTIYSPEQCLMYLEKFATEQQFVVGLILGQTTESRENVIHLARTPEEKNTDKDSSPDNIRPQNLLGISDAWIADHAKHVTKMLPGGMFVLGIFITSPEDVFEDPNLFSKVKGILFSIYRTLDMNPYMYGNCPTTNERLVLHMNNDTKVLTCKSVEINSSKWSTIIKPVDWKFLAKTQVWQQLDCYYEFDEIYPVIVKNNGISVKQQFQQILGSVFKAIQTSIMFLDGEYKEDSETLEQLAKKKRPKTATKTDRTQEVPKSIQVSMFVPYENTKPDVVEYMECDGSIHFSGVVGSRAFMSPAANVAETLAAVRQDIVRSLAARFMMHCDALVDDNLLSEEKVCFNEPPRRVLVPLPGGLQLCDYLFPGEAPREALASVAELLDLHIQEADVVCDVETPADTSEFEILDRDASSEELISSAQDTSRVLYLAGIAFASLVLIISIAIHYYDQILHFFGM